MYNYQKSENAHSKRMPSVGTGSMANTTARNAKDVRKVTFDVAPAFDDYLFSWDYPQYLSIGGYGSGKSYHTAIKIILKLLQEKRTCLVVRNVFASLKESCYNVLCGILVGVNLLTTNQAMMQKNKNKIYAKLSPLELIFPNGSRIIFKGLDKPDKIKSIHDVSIVWVEEAAEIRKDAYSEIIGRVRSPDLSTHILMTCNPVSKSNWIYKHFFVSRDKDGNRKVKLEPEVFYKSKMLVLDNVYYHHSTIDDNPFLQKSYRKSLDAIQKHDYPLYLVVRHGMFGATGIRVLPQAVTSRHDVVEKNIAKIPLKDHYYGFDLGFEESYNAVISCAIDTEKNILYIYDEIYMNKMTDVEFSKNEDFMLLKEKILQAKRQGVYKHIVADSSDPKAIAYYQSQEYPMRACTNRFKGSRLANTRKIKRFSKIFISSKCINTVSELIDLTYKKTQAGELYQDIFAIDPHTFSALWYALDTVEVADYKIRKYSTKKG
jgi:phage terminase large subunit